jgi:hypothetical protein
MSVIVAAWRLRLGGLWFEFSLDKYFVRPYHQNNQRKMTGSVSQCLLCKCEALNSNPPPKSINQSINKVRNEG